MTADLPDTTGGDQTSVPWFEPERLEALRQLGLTSAADPEMERFAQRVHDQLNVPLALVTLVHDQEQVFPGMWGLPAPWSELRSTPLDRSFCQHVVTTGKPLVITDVDKEPLVAQDITRVVFGVVAYAGQPLTDDQGHVLGSLCALDTVVREWTPHELRLLDDLARDCRNELRLRLSRLDAQRERERLQIQIDRSHRMLVMAELFNETRSVVGVRARMARITDEAEGFSAAALHTIDDIQTRAPGISPAVFKCVRRNAIVSHPDLLERERGVPAALRRHHAQDGIRGVVCAPIIGSNGLLGVLEMLWLLPRVLDDQEHTMTATLASYIAQALDRAHLIEHRIGVAHALQAAMLTTMPDVAGLPMAACYLPANTDEWVGGDWYDAIVLPVVDGDRDLAVAVTVGDVIGHDIAAATVMGQARAMLRQAAFDFLGQGPAEVFTRFEEACAALGVPARGTAVLAYLERFAATGSWSMTWTSAGHPPPLLALPDGSVQRLELSVEDQGLLFGFRDVYDAPRIDSRIDLPPGSTVLLYSDGVIEVPGVHVDKMLDELGDVVGREQAGGPQAVVDAVSLYFGNGSDDLVAVAIQIPA